MESMLETQRCSMLTHVDAAGVTNSPAIRAGFGTTGRIPTYTAV